MCGRFAFEHEWPALLDLYELPVEEVETLRLAST